MRQMLPMLSRSMVALATLLVLPAAATADDFFRDRVAPILEARCLGCHNSLDQKGDFALQRRDELLGSGYVEAGDTEGSHLLSTLVSVVPGEKPSMPKDSKPLTDEQVAVIRQWIADGANWPEGLVLEEPVIDDFDWCRTSRSSGQPLPSFDSPPELANWVRSPIDAFVLRKLNEARPHAIARS